MSDESERKDPGFAFEADDEECFPDGRKRKFS